MSPHIVEESLTPKQSISPVREETIFVVGIRKLGIILVQLGINPIRFGRSLRGLFPFFRNLSIAAKQGFDGWPVRLFPIFGDRYEQSGTPKGHYFHIDLWAARIVHDLAFDRVIDVGSRIDGFVAHLLVFRDVEILDVRPLTIQVSGARFKRVDITKSESIQPEYADCVTSLHALEHFGLGRYSDEVDMEAWKKGFANLAALVKPGGTLLLAVPIGRERLDFDAHRVFNPLRIIEQAKKHGLSLTSFAFVDDEGMFHESGDPLSCKTLNYGCGCFHFARVPGSHLRRSTSV